MEETTFYHNTVVQIRFNDIDVLGHVNNATIQEYFDLGRMYYMDKVFGDSMFSGNETIIVASINTDFMCPIYLKDEIEVKTAIVHLGNKSLKMEQQVVNRESGVIKATCKSVMVGFHKKTEEAIVLKPEWRKAVSKQEQKTF